MYLVNALTAHPEALDRIHSCVTAKYSEIQRYGEEEVEKRCHKKMALRIADMLLAHNIIKFDKHYTIDGINYEAVLYVINFDKLRKRGVE